MLETATATGPVGGDVGWKVAALDRPVGAFRFRSMENSLPEEMLLLRCPRLPASCAGHVTWAPRDAAVGVSEQVWFVGARQDSAAVLCANSSSPIVFIF